MVQQSRSSSDNGRESLNLVPANQSVGAHMSVNSRESRALGSQEKSNTRKCLDTKGHQDRGGRIQIVIHKQYIATVFCSTMGPHDVGVSG